MNDIVLGFIFISFWGIVGIWFTFSPKNAQKYFININKGRYKRNSKGQRPFGLFKSYYITTRGKSIEHISE